MMVMVWKTGRQASYLKPDGFKTIIKHWTWFLYEIKSEGNILLLLISISGCWTCSWSSPQFLRCKDKCSLLLLFAFARSHCFHPCLLARSKRCSNIFIRASLRVARIYSLRVLFQRQYDMFHVHSSLWFLLCCSTHLFILQRTVLPIQTWMVTITV